MWWTLRCRCRCGWVPENETLDIWRVLARRSTHLGNLVHDKVVSLSGAESKSATAWRPPGWHDTRDGTRKLAYESGQTQQAREGRAIKRMENQVQPSRVQHEPWQQ